MKARLKNDGSNLENEAGNHLNLILESQTPDANNIEEGQVNGLLEILDARPDVQVIHCTHTHLIHTYKSN